MLGHEPGTSAVESDVWTIETWGRCRRFGGLLEPHHRPRDCDRECSKLITPYGLFKP